MIVRQEAKTGRWGSVNGSQRRSLPHVPTIPLAPLSGLPLALRHYPITVLCLFCKTRRTPCSCSRALCRRRPFEQSETEREDQPGTEVFVIVICSRWRAYGCGQVTVMGRHPEDLGASQRGDGGRRYCDDVRAGSSSSKAAGLRGGDTEHREDADIAARSQLVGLCAPRDYW